MANADSLAPAFEAAVSISDTVSVPVAKDLPVFISKTYEIKGIVTDLWVQLFADQIVVGISQLSGKIGTYIQCDIEETIIDNTTRFNYSVLLGKRDDPLLGVYGRRIMEHIAGMRKNGRAEACPPLLLGISVKEEAKDPEIFAAIVDLVIKLYKEAIQAASR